MRLFPKGAETWMEAALDLAEQARQANEVPIGAVVVQDGEIISGAHNLVETRQDASQHAELLAIQSASQVLNSWRLPNATLVVTLEPCSMCIGALILARVPTLIFGCKDPRQGAVGSVFDLSQQDALPHKVSVYSGVLAERCQDVLQEFFRELRKER